MRRAGLFLGAAILGLWCAAWLEPLAGAPLGATSSPRFLSLLLAVVGVLLAVASPDRFLRSAWIVFAIRYAIIALPIPVGPPIALSATVLTAIFASLLIVAGARHQTARVLVVALAVFGCAILFRFATTAYSKRVVAGYRVVR